MARYKYRHRNESPTVDFIDDSAAVTYREASMRRNTTPLNRKQKSIDFHGMIQAGENPKGFVAFTPNGVSKANGDKDDGL